MTVSYPPELPLRLHQHALDTSGVPEWTHAFATRMRGITAPNWWVFDPIIVPLRQEGYTRQIAVVRGLYGKTAIPGGVHVLCRMLHISYQTARNDFKRIWNLAYDRYHATYPGVMQCRFYDELWHSATSSSGWGQSAVCE